MFRTSANSGWLMRETTAMWTARPSATVALSVYVPSARVVASATTEPSLSATSCTAAKRMGRRWTSPVKPPSPMTRSS